MSTTGNWGTLFGGRKWRVAEELTGRVTVRALMNDGSKRRPTVTVEFRRGEFELPAGFAYQSPLSTNFARRGVVLQETDAAGALDVPGSRIAIGAVAVEQARRDYSAVW